MNTATAIGTITTADGLTIDIIARVTDELDGAGEVITDLTQALHEFALNQDTSLEDEDEDGDIAIDIESTASIDNLVYQLRRNLGL